MNSRHTAAGVATLFFQYMTSAYPIPEKYMKKIKRLRQAGQSAVKTPP